MQKEDAYKRTLKAFLTEMLKMGSVKGFKYFAMYMRGREELILSVVNEPMVRIHSNLNCVKHFLFLNFSGTPNYV